MTGTRVYGGIEAGGTKVVCAIGDGSGSLRDRTTIPTTTPAATLRQVMDYFRAHRRDGHRIAALGVASFGPLDLTPGSSTFGHITTTTKPGWAGTDLVGAIREHFDVPIALDTDVNGAAYAEHRWGAGRGTDDLTYLTVGTGIGGGVIVRGEPLHGMLHPEMGHLPPQRHPRDTFAGSCPFHGDCLEGVASGPAIARRIGRPTTELGDAHDEVVTMEAFYLAQLVASVIYLLMPQRIVLGGGVLDVPGLLEAVRAATVERLANALDLAAVTTQINHYLVRPALGGAAGVIGAIGLAERLTH